MTLCSCGCGLEAREGRRYISGHNMKTIEAKERVSKSFKGKHPTEQTRKKLSESRKGRHLSEETKLKISKSEKGKIISEETRMKISEANKGNQYHLGHKHSEESKRKNSEKHKGKKHSKNTKQKLSKLVKGNNHPFYGKHHTEETKQKISESLTGRFAGENHPMFGKKHSLETRQKISDHHADMKGEKSPLWHGGISYLPYCSKFNFSFKERVRDFFGRVCINCNKTELENGQCLSVHHVNYDKMACCNDIKPLLVPLCRSCNTKVNHNRSYWHKYFEDLIIENYNGQCYLPKEEKNNVEM